MEMPEAIVDLSALTDPQFLAFFFDRPVVGDAKEYYLFRSGNRRFCRSESINCRNSRPGNVPELVASWLHSSAAVPHSGSVGVS
jgi:hypothetical protein